MFSPLSYQTDVPLSTLTTLGIGGPARYVVEVKTIEALTKAIGICQRHEIPFFILGKGSNCLFDDRGFNGAILLNKLDFLEKPVPGTFHVGAGYSFALLGVQTARSGWSGLEFASGIPATIGGAVFMNAGANGSETCQHLISVDYIKADGTHVVLHKEDLAFGYRTSSFQEMSGAIAGATFTLVADPEARKRQLAIVEYRTRTQPYGDKSAGCIFRNPLCAAAGALIEQSGLKGIAVGDAAVSTLHANFIVNKGEAKAQDVLALIALIQEQVQKRTGNQLEAEVRIVPYEGVSLYVPS